MLKKANSTIYVLKRWQRQPSLLPKSEQDRDPSFEGYDTYLDDRMKAVLPACMKQGTKIISNQGWINPDAAAQRIVHWLQHFGYKGVKVASVNGSLITDKVLSMTDKILENGLPTL